MKNNFKRGNNHNIQKYIKDDGSLNQRGKFLLLIILILPFAIIPSICSIIYNLTGRNLDSYGYFVMWIWSMLGLAISRLCWHDQKPFARWSKSRERENQQSATSTSDNEIRETKNEKD